MPCIENINLYHFNMILIALCIINCSKEKNFYYIFRDDKMHIQYTVLEISYFLLLLHFFTIAKE